MLTKGRNKYAMRKYGMGEIALIMSNIFIL